MIDDSLTNSITNMAEHSHKIWAVNWFLKNFSIGFPLPKLFQTVFFFLGGGGGGGGGGCKKCWVRQRERASMARLPL